MSMLNSKHDDETVVQPLVIPTDKTKCAFGLLLSLCLFAGFLVIAINERTNLLACFFLVFFGICALIWTFMILPGSHLRLDEHGFILIAPFRRLNLRWHAIEHFGMTRFGVMKFVYFKTMSPKSLNRPLVYINKSINGYDDILPNVFGLTSQELLDLLVDWHTRFGQIKQSPP